MGRLQLRRYDDLINGRRQVAGWYEERLCAEGFEPFPWHVRPTYSHFPLAVRNRRAVCEKMRQRDVQLGTLIGYACPDLPGYEEHAGTCPNASWFALHMINLPNWPGMVKRKVDFVVDAMSRLRDKFPDWFFSDVPATASSPTAGRIWHRHRARGGVLYSGNAGIRAFGGGAMPGPREPAAASSTCRSRQP